nr:DUF222 domain-containing protein [Frankia sp. CpI1-P]
MADPELDGAALDCSALLVRLAAVRLGLVREMHGRGSALREGATSTAALIAGTISRTVPAYFCCHVRPRGTRPARPSYT